MTKKTDQFSIFECKPTLAETGVHMPILHPVTLEETGAFIITKGTDSKLWKQIQLERTRKNIIKQNRKQKQKDKDITVEELADAINTTKEDYAKLIIGWENLAPNFEFSEKNLSVLLSDDSYDWLFDQHIAFVEAKGNFFETSKND